VSGLAVQSATPAESVEHTPSLSHCVILTILGL
jgi:hypothetical protein